MLSWPEPDRLVEAGPTGPARDAQRAHRAAIDVVGEYHGMENGAAQQLMKRLDTLQQALRQRLTQQITDFRRFTLQQLLADVDRLMADVRTQIERDQAGNFTKAGQLGTDAAVKPIEAIRIRPDQVPGLDGQIITATFGNAVDLLSVPMQQFTTEVKAALRRVVLAGDSKMEELQRLQKSIAGQGFDNAQYRAERILRTEMGRVFNQATYAKLEGLAQQFPFLKKGWRATPGNRTRIGHAEAGRTYARGKGIPIAQRFVIRVFDERNKKEPKQIGLAQLRFPIDPETTPAGRIAAAATILCRCNAFVDIDVAAYAAYTQQRVGRMNLGAAPGQLPEPPAAAPRKPKYTQLPGFPDPASTAYKGNRFLFNLDGAIDWAARHPGATVKKEGGFYVVRNAQGLVMGPKGWMDDARMKKPAAPKVPVGAPAAAVAAPVVAQGKAAAGTSVSSKLQIQATKLWNTAREAMADIDKVHGDGPLNQITLKGSGAKTYYGCVNQIRGRGISGMELTNTGRADHPKMTMWHETGHWLDSMGLAKGNVTAPEPETKMAWNRKARKFEPYTRPGVPPKAPPGATSIGEWSSADVSNKALEEWRQAVVNSRAVQTMQGWQDESRTRRGVEPAPGIPARIDYDHLRYLLQTHEVFARSYAQYIAVRSKDAVGLKELAKLQALGKPGSQGIFPAYPRQWEDDDFEPIAKAFDRLFDSLGWRR